MIPTFDGTDVRQFERRVRLFVFNTRMATERRARKLLERLEARAFDSFEGTQDLETPNGVENLLDHLRTHFEPIQPQRRGRIVDDFVFDLERQPSEGFQTVVGQEHPLIKAHVFVNLSTEKQSKIVSAAMNRCECEPLRNAMLPTISRGGALRGSVPCIEELVEGQNEEKKYTSSRQRKLLTTSWRPSSRKQCP